jgi:predicted dehydrogenase/threonine dehydrogenase-like Zn-dependent dehydrogenase
VKQLLQNMRSGETQVVEVPVPVVRPGSALVRTAASLVSAGTERMLVDFAGKSLVGKARSRPDLVRQVLDKARREGLLTTAEAAFNRLDQPMALGYSSAGTIVAAGAGLPDFRVGQRVACAGGGYAVHAEYAVVPANLLASLPDSVDFEAGAFATLGAIALHGFRLADTQLGERVAVIGLGLLGLLAVQIAAAAGCSVIGFDLDERRVELGRALGVEAALRQDAEQAASSFSRGHGCDAVIICADTPTSDPVELAGTIARDRGRVIAVGAVGLNIPRKIYYEKELTFLNSRSYGPGRYDPVYEEKGQDYPLGYVRWTEGRNLQAFIDLLAARRLDMRPLITHRFPIEQAPQAYELITGKTAEPYLGILLTYPETTGLATREQTVQLKTQAAQTGAATVAVINKVALGVLGAGNFASAVLLPALKSLPDVELMGIASGSGVSARNAAGKFGFSYATSDVERILADPSINTVAILTRHNLHASQALAALQAGKHTFCEKPLALTTDELDSIAQALAAPGAPLFMVGFNRRFASLSARLADSLKGRSEPLMAHYRVNAGYLPPQHWLHDEVLGGGRIIGEACHFIDYLAFLVGQAPSSVTAVALPDGGRYHEDNAVLTFDFPDGSVGTVTYLANGNRAFPKERVEVFSAGQVAVLDDFRSLELVKDGKRSVERSRLRQDKGHRGEWLAFTQAILSGGPAPIPYAHLIGVTRASFAALQALRGRERITIAPA